MYHILMDLNFHLKNSVEELFVVNIFWHFAVFSTNKMYEFDRKYIDLVATIDSALCHTRNNRSKFVDFYWQVTLYDSFFVIPHDATNFGARIRLDGKSTRIYRLHKISPRNQKKEQNFQLVLPKQSAFLDIPTKHLACYTVHVNFSPLMLYIMAKAEHTCLVWLGHPKKYQTCRFSSRISCLDFQIRTFSRADIGVLEAKSVLSDIGNKWLTYWPYRFHSLKVHFAMQPSHWD